MAAPMTHRTSVFISYSRIDNTTVDRLEAELISYGFNTWVDREHLEGGDKWAAQIERAIQASDIVVVGLSPDSVISPWVTNELFYAQQLGKPIIPVLLRPVERIPLMLAATQYIDMHADESQGLQQLRLRLLRLGEQTMIADSIQQIPRQSTAPERIAPTVEQRPNDPATQLVALPAAAPVADLNDLFIQGIAARSHDDLEQAEALLRQVVERDAHFGNGVAAQQLEDTQRQLLPIQLERLRNQAQQAEARGAWDEALGAWQALLGRMPDDAQAQIALKRDRQNRDAAWLYGNARALAQQQDWVAFRHMWQLLLDQAPNYGDPDRLYLLSLAEYAPGTLLLTCQESSTLYDLSWSPDGQRFAAWVV
ncbi:MAG TPA: TIR domain-containing protein [Ktedonobacterales bacterium]|jgi:tetratricopeptide (TPR) repeat protein